MLDQLRNQPQSAKRDSVIENLSEGMMMLFARAQGIDEALKLVNGKESVIPPEIQRLIELFGK